MCEWWMVVQEVEPNPDVMCIVDGCFNVATHLVLIGKAEFFGQLCDVSECRCAAHLPSTN